MNMIEEESIDLMELVRALWKNILLIALTAVLVGSAAFAYTAFRITPQYQATTSLYVNSSSFRLGTTNYSVSTSDMSMSNSLVSVYLYILKSRTTMEEVIQEADLSYSPEQLSSMIYAQGVSGTAAIEITVTSTDPSEAELIANTIAKILPVRITDIVDGSSVRVVDYAIIPSRRSGPNIVRNTMLGILAGVVLSAAVVIVFSLLNGRSREVVKSADDLRAMYPDMMVLAMIPDMSMSEKRNGYYSAYYGEVNTKKKEEKSHGRSRGA